MVKNNGIPIEVKKPFETVCELKNEVPSFEEFMKTYENDGSVNYDELNGGSIGEVRGYGPIVQSDYWGDWEYLEIPCVSKDCSSTDKTPRQWYHDDEDCRSYGQRMLWSTKARIKCIYCDNPSHISNWLFKCHRCPKYGEYLKTKYLKAIKIAHDASKVNPNFSSMLFEYIADHESEFN